MAKRDATIVKTLRDAHFDNVSFSNKTREYIVKRGFFYTHGVTTEMISDRVKQAIPNAKITLSTERWNAWPKDSFWEVRFTVPSEN